MKELLRKVYFVFVIIGVIFIIGWKCPIQLLTGYPCPGCMMTTAAYYFMKFDFITAFQFNPAIFILLIGGIVAFIYRKNEKALQLIGFTILILWLLTYMVRLFTLFPEWPMPYEENNLIQYLLNKAS